MAKKRGGRESNVGLIVTLIFFILLSIGLGVSTYYGFAQQKDLTDKAGAADKVMKEAQAERDWYQFQALTYRAYLGQTTGMDQPIDPKTPASTYETVLRQRRSEFNTSGFGKARADYATVQAVINAVESKKFTVIPDEKKGGQPTVLTLAWDSDKMRPRASFEDVFNSLLGTVNYQTQQTKAMQDRFDEAQKAKTLAEEEKKSDKVAMDKEYNQLKAKNDDDLKKTADFQKGFEDKYNALQQTKDTAILAEEDKLKAQLKEVALRDEKIKDMTTKLKSVQDQLDKLAAKDLEAPVNGRPIPTEWKIVRMDRSGKQPFINLGQADNVRPAMTFSIHGQGADGRPMPQSKGTLEVIDVVGEHLSQAQVVNVKDAQKDPVLPGDYLYNPIFRAGAQQHVVLAGPVHMHGTKDDDTEEFKRLLDRQHVVVDGFVDTDGTVKGKLSVATDFLVLGDEAAVSEAGRTSIHDLENQARNNGVNIIKARDFLESIGYNSP